MFKLASLFALILCALALVFVAPALATSTDCPTVTSSAHRFTQSPIPGGTLWRGLGTDRKFVSLNVGRLSNLLRARRFGLETKLPKNSVVQFVQFNVTWKGGGFTYGDGWHSAVAIRNKPFYRLTDFPLLPSLRQVQTFGWMPSRLSTNELRRADFGLDLGAMNFGTVPQRVEVYSVSVKVVYCR